VATPRDFDPPQMGVWPPAPLWRAVAYMTGAPSAAGLWCTASVPALRGSGPGMPTEFPPGLVGYAQTDADKGRAVATATPVRICFMLLILWVCSSLNGALLNHVPPRAARRFVPGATACSRERPTRAPLGLFIALGQAIGSALGGRA
jgi:hypothetical protein